jgi:hypothetical protein
LTGPDPAGRAPFFAGRRRSAILIAVVGAMLAISVVHEPTTVPFTPCLVKNVTGLPCPSCGMTRAFHALATGHLHDAVHFNIASPAVFAAAWVILVLALADLLLRPGLLDRVWARTRRPLVWAVVAAMSAAWTVNLARHFGERTLLQSLADSGPARLVMFVGAQLQTLLG